VARVISPTTRQSKDSPRCLPVMSLKAGSRADDSKTAPTGAPGAHDLPYTDLLHPAGGAGGGQVHEIDTGNEQYKKRDQAEKTHIRDTSPGGPAVLVAAVQVAWPPGDPVFARSWPSRNFPVATSSNMP